MLWGWGRNNYTFSAFDYNFYCITHPFQIRLKAQEKKIDHMERAKRMEEIPLLKEQHELLKAERKQVWEDQEQERIQKEKEQRASDIANKKRLMCMAADKDAYLETLINERKSSFEKKLKEFQGLYSAEKEKRLEQRAEERKEERRAKWYQEKVRRVLWTANLVS